MGVARRSIVLLVLLLVACGGPAVTPAASPASPPATPRLQAATTSLRAVAAAPATPPIAAASPAGSPPLASPAATPATVVELFLPFGATGLRSDFRVAERLSGACFAGSAADAARPDAWRCMVGNRILDPCFDDGHGGQDPLACVKDPWSREVVELTVAAPLPRQHGNTGDFTQRHPWALELVGGARCVLLTGATTAIGGKRVNAGCLGGGYTVGAPDHSRPVWRVAFLRDLKDRAAPLDERAVAAAWY